MNFALTDLMPLLPEIFLLAAVSFILIFDLFLSDEHRYITYILSLSALLGCGWLTFTGATGEVVYAMHGMFVSDMLGDLLKLVVYFSVAVTMVYSREYIRVRGMFQGEFFVLMLFATLGMMVMISASHFLTLYMGLELLSLSLYALVALQRDSAVAAEAAMKYFVLGALASGMLLYGMSMLYGATGSLEIAKVAAVLQQGLGNKYRTGLRFGIRGGGACVQAGRGAVPYVDSRCLSGCANGSDAVHRYCQQSSRVGFRIAYLGTRLATAIAGLAIHAGDHGGIVHGGG
jgi:NADH-quinone oxidoreductase subunit N